MINLVGAEKDRRRADAACVLAQIGPMLHIERELAGGFQSGAWLVTDPQGCRCVLKTSGASWAPRVVAAEPLVERLRSNGYPTPRWMGCGRLPDGTGWVLQEFVRGEEPPTLAAALDAGLLELVETQHAGAAPAGAVDWTAYVVVRCGRAGDGLRSSIVARAPDTAVPFARLSALCRRAATSEWPNRDLVHGDFSLQNLLVAGGRITGVVDIEALGCGSRAYDLLTLSRQHHIWPAQPSDAGSARRCVERAAAVAPAEFLAAAALVQLTDLWLFGIDQWTAGAADVDGSAHDVEAWIDEIEDVTTR
jgi:hypothetical protein